MASQSTASIASACPETRLEWAGAERTFALPLGCILDLEEACGKVGFGEIYLRMGSHRYFARDVYHTIHQGLIGGGIAASEAKRLLDERFDLTPIGVHVQIALEILITAMSGVEAKSEGSGEEGTPEPLDKGKIFAALIKIGLTPDQVRAMRYDDYVALCRAAGGAKVEPPSEEAYEAMLAAHEERERQRADASP
ncbi:gene transfer agent family protein [Aestuariibius insulae]|uniref:gene transfer agent family protein n=1 Tax=Aestuariibius insulae TaxID=2058287 RepID=UPI00345EF5D0